MSSKTYTGIGSRQTPLSVYPLIIDIATLLNIKDYTLRSGGAEGADMMFEKHAVKKEIYLAWKGFNGNKSDLYHISDDAWSIAREFHPAFNKLPIGAKKLMARNTYQILGLDCKTPTDFVICWTKDGKPSGGTGQAMRIASEFKIPIFNLFHKQDIKSLRNHMGQL